MFGNGVGVGCISCCFAYSKRSVVASVGLFRFGITRGAFLLRAKAVKTWVFMCGAFSYVAR